MTFHDISNPLGNLHRLRKFLHRLITNVFFSAFVLERGRVVLRLSTTDVQCKTVSFKPDSFQSNESRINVQTSINYFNSTGSFVHDAAVTWVESVTFTSFKVCALKAGRAERLTPDSGVTFVDYIAFQESPAGAVSSQLDYYKRLTLESWFTNLEQTPLNRCQQLPAAYKRLV